MLPHNHSGAVQAGLASDQPGAKESAMERVGDVWRYPQAKAVSSAALAARVVELELELAALRSDPARIIVTNPPCVDFAISSSNS